MSSDKLSTRTYPMPDEIISRLDQLHKANARKHLKKGLRCPKRTTLAMIMSLGCEALEQQLKNQ